MLTSAEFVDLCTDLPVPTWTTARPGGHVALTIAAMKKKQVAEGSRFSQIAVKCIHLTYTKIITDKCADELEPLVFLRV